MPCAGWQGNGPDVLNDSPTRQLPLASAQGYRQKKTFEKPTSQELFAVDE